MSPPETEGAGEVRSEVQGDAGNVVQSRNIAGGIHFHHPPSYVSASAVPQQLPWDVRGFVGRAEALDRLDDLLAENQSHPHTGFLVVVTGTAGVGKTSLIVRWAHENREAFPDGSLYVNLRAYDPGKPVEPAVALARFLRALGVADSEIPFDLDERVESFRSLVARRRMLIILDNAVSVGQVRPLLPGAGPSMVLVASRSRLSGLVARDGAHRLILGLLSEHEAIRLVRVTLADYRPADRDTEIAQLARLCARLPLALRIAAERAAARPLMPLAELIADLREESSLWDALALADEDEADAVRSVFAWSYRTLAAPAARLFRLLGLHPGLDISLGAAAALAGVPIGRVRGLLDLLAGANLLEQTGPERYQFHDLLRAYAADQARHEPDESRAGLRRVLLWYLHGAAAAVKAVQTFFSVPPLDPPPAEISTPAFTSRQEASVWYQSEQDNLRAAGEAAAMLGLDEIAWQLPAVLHPMHSLRNPLDHWLAMARTGLDAARRLDHRHAQALMLTSLGVAYAYNRPFATDEAVASLNEALRIYGETGDRVGGIEVTNALGVLHLRVRRLPEAAGYFQQTAATARASTDSQWEAVALGNLAHVRLEEGDLAAAAGETRATLQVLRAAGADARVMASYLTSLARIHRELGELGDAEGQLRAAMSLVESAAPAERAYTLLEEGRLHHANRRLDEAAAAYQQAATLYRSLNDHMHEAETLDAVGEVYAAAEQPDQAVDFHRRAAAAFAHLGRPWDRAVALEHLAAALVAAGEPDASVPHRRQVLELIEPFTDTRADALRARTGAALDGAPRQP